MMNKKKIIVIDTNVLVHDPTALLALKNGGNNLVVIPWMVLIELDNLKNRRDIGHDAREALRQIDELKGEKFLRLEAQPEFSLLRKFLPGFLMANGLSEKNPDHCIIQTAGNCLKDLGEGYSEVVLVSRDRAVRIMAERVFPGLLVEDYKKDSVSDLDLVIKEINVRASEIRDGWFTYDPSHGQIAQNEGVVCFSDYNDGGVWRKSFAAILKGDRFKIIPEEINAFGIKPKSLDGGEHNWAQCIALHHLLDREIKLVFLQGGAGTGKTLLALAGALDQLKKYDRMIITRPMVHLEDKDNMGFLPGDEQAKMAPWIRPIQQNLEYIKREMDCKGRSYQVKKLEYNSLDYIRGTTIHGGIVIIDEAQNLSPHQVKTIITRAGLKTKMIFTGDLGQVDRRRMLGRHSNGLAYAIHRLRGQKIVGVTVFGQVVRSELAALAERLL